MFVLVVESWVLLAYFDVLMKFGDLDAIHSRLLGRPSQPRTSGAESHCLCRAIDYACVFYFKPVLCLQRSSATTALLRSQGYEAQLVIGAKILPFDSHAWVEIEGQVVNDKQDFVSTFLVMERW
jgi:hypothetical protein